MSKTTTITDSVKCNLPSKATPEEKLTDVMAQLKEKYQGQKVYALWQIEKENRDIKSATLAKWVKQVTGMTLREYLLDQGVLSPMVCFNMQEDEVELEEIKGKRCCALAQGGGRDKFREDSLRKLGAKIVPPTNAKLDYLFIFRPQDILKEPADRNQDAYWLMSQKESGASNFRILAGRFYDKLRAYEQECEKNAHCQPQESSQLPDIGIFTDILTLPKKENNPEVTFDAAGKTWTLTNTIDYSAPFYKFETSETHVSLEQLSECIKELLDFDYSALYIRNNYKSVLPVEQQLVQENWEQFSRICKLCQHEAVMKLISYAIARNKDGSPRKRAVTPIVYTAYIPVDFSKSRMQPSSFYYYVLVAKNNEDSVHLEIRRKDLVYQKEEDNFEQISLPKISEELVTKILRLGDMLN